MARIIPKAFTGNSLSPQVRYRHKKFLLGLCRDCHDPAAIGSLFCVKHLVEYRERQRIKKQCVKRYSHANSYWNEAQEGVRSILREP